MPDFRSYFDSEFIGAWDLDGADRTVKIAGVSGGEITGEGGRKSRKLVLTFDGVPKPMVCNKTNARTIAALYGNDASAWVGRKVTLYPTTTTMGAEVKDCLRVRPVAPVSKAKTEAAS